MNGVMETRWVAAPPAAVEDAKTNFEGFVRSAGFDEVDVDRETMRVVNKEGIAEIELKLGVVDRWAAALADAQREAIVFLGEMWTNYTDERRADGDESEVAACSVFPLEVPMVATCWNRRSSSASAAGNRTHSSTAGH